MEDWSVKSPSLSSECFFLVRGVTAPLSGEPLLGVPPDIEWYCGILGGFIVGVSG